MDLSASGRVSGTLPERPGELSDVTPPTPWGALRDLRPDLSSVQRVMAVWSANTDRHRAFVLHATRAMGSQLSSWHPLNPASGSTAGLEMMDALIDAIERREDPVALEQGWLRLGNAHAAAGLSDLDYRPLGHAVFHAAHSAFLDVWSTELGSALVAYYVWVSAWVTHGSHLASGTDGSPFDDPDPVWPVADSDDRAPDASGAAAPE